MVESMSRVESFLGGRDGPAREIGDFDCDSGGGVSVLESRAGG